MINKKIAAVVVTAVLAAGMALSVYAAAQHGRPGNNSNGSRMEMNAGDGGSGIVTNRRGGGPGMDTDQGDKGPGQEMNRENSGRSGSGPDRGRPAEPPGDSSSMNRMPGGPMEGNRQGQSEPGMGLPDQGRPSGNSGGQNRPDTAQEKPNGENPMDLEIEEQIDSITDSETKEKLTSLYEAFKNAMDSERELLDSGSTDSGSLEEARDAVKEAMDALIAAFQDAGLEMSKPEPPSDRGNDNV